MKHVLTVALLILYAVCVPRPALAASPALVARSNTGAVVELYQEPGLCIDGAKLAAWVSPDALHRVTGCWRLAGTVVEIAFFDADSLKVPAGAFKAAEVL